MPQKVKQERTEMAVSPPLRGDELWERLKELVAEMAHRTKQTRGRDVSEQRLPIGSHNRDFAFPRRPGSDHGPPGAAWSGLGPLQLPSGMRPPARPNSRTAVPDELSPLLGPAPPSIEAAACTAVPGELSPPLGSMPSSTEAAACTTILVQLRPLLGPVPSSTGVGIAE
ncbi:hypothetical protein EOD39_0974 [Acipenser ruthenus]|uniref:Uncharacterized protein n=1 Tax=Acipenser ruthenus TaxID=7906 RepID=A0A444UJ13_ACIRT|nr:hypothetical protein EOD39_0974 [Acipenser ruthenus]